VISLNSPDEVSPAMFEKFSRPYEERLVKELAAEEIFTAIHICGDTTRIVDSLAGYDFCGFELDDKTDMALAKKTAGARHVLSRTLIPAASSRAARRGKSRKRRAIGSACGSPAGISS